MKTTTWETKLVNVVDLFLDEENVRLDHSSGPASQDALAHDLFVNQDAYELAQGIARNGLFQHELPIVIEDGKRLVVIEGNRRVAALKGLIQPSLVPSHSAKLEQLKKSSEFLPISSIEVKVAPSRAAALQLLAAIHTTESRKPWTTLRQAYFYYAQVQSKSRNLKQLVSEYPNVDVPRFIRMWEMHQIARSISYDTPEDASRVADQLNFPITTLERIYDNEAFQVAFGVAFDKNGKATIKAESDSFKQAYKRIIEDIINKSVTSRTHNKASDIKTYVENLQKPSLAGSGKTTASKEYKPVPPPKRERTAKGLAPKDIVCTLNSPGVKRILKELQQLDYRKFPNAAHDLLRSFLECSFKAYFAHKNIVVPSKSHYTYLSDVLVEAEKHFQTVNKKLVQPVKIIHGSAGNASANYLFSKDRLDAANHNPAVFSTGEQVKDAWDQMEEILRFILKP